jgi:hypothetical protein
LREEGYSGKIELTLKDETNRKQKNACILGMIKI